MTWPQIYLLFPGNAQEALEFYRSVFGGEVETHTFAEFGRHDGAPDLLAHASLQGDVSLYLADAGADEDAVNLTGAMLSLLGNEPERQRAWFDRLASTGRVVTPLERRPWGAIDGQVIDPFGVRWLVGFPVDS